MNNFSKEFAILLVDDDKSNIDILVGALGGEYKLVVAMDGASALEIVADEAPDLVLLDIMMPGMDGFEVCKRLKADQKTRYIPVIFVTAMSGEMDETIGLELGAIDYISKPISPAIVKKRVKNHLELKRLHDQERAYLKQLEQEKEKSDLLLANILPDSIAAKLKECKDVIAESFPETTVMFIDLVGFTELSGRITAVKLVSILNEIFSTFDSLAEKHKVEKIKTTGDSYMVVGGLLPEQRNHAEIIVDMALEIIDEIARYAGPDGESFNIRIGINTGPVIAGVIGTKKYSFDLWGETVNIASRMESQGAAGRIQVTESTYQRISPKYRFEKRETIHVKGKGKMQTYFILGKLAQQET